MREPCLIKSISHMHDRCWPMGRCHHTTKFPPLFPPLINMFFGPFINAHDYSVSYIKEKMVTGELAIICWQEKLVSFVFSGTGWKYTDTCYTTQLYVHAVALLLPLNPILIFPVLWVTFFHGHIFIGGKFRQYIIRTMGFNLPFQRFCLQTKSNQSNEIIQVYIDLDLNIKHLINRSSIQLTHVTRIYCPAARQK